MTLTILSAAVIGEAVILAGVLTLLVHMRARLARVSDVSTAAIAQMSDLVREAKALSADLTAQIGEQADLCESLTAQVEEAAVLTQRATIAAQEAAEEPRTTRKPVTRKPAARTAAEPAATRTRRKAVEAADDEPTPLRARSRKTAVAGSADAVPAHDPLADAETARQKGMDPISIAIQRNLAKQRALSV